jgi:hypothetical protein
MDTARLGFVASQIREIEEIRQKRLEQQGETTGVSERDPPLR